MSRTRNPARTLSAGANKVKTPLTRLEFGVYDSGFEFDGLRNDCVQEYGSMKRIDYFGWLFLISWPVWERWLIPPWPVFGP